jgi:O-acetyl-ADP-ribose deacetylase (regulator of RNase III)
VAAKSHKMHVGGAMVVVKQGDITREDTDAIVNAANSSLLGGGGVDGAIHRAGGPAILEDCKRIVARIGRCPTGEAVITTGGKLAARHVIHTVGPVWHGDPDDSSLLAAAYRNSLQLASEHDLASISFPSISTGAYRYPIEQASRVALRTVFEELPRSGLKEVRFVLFSDADLDVYLETARDVGAEFGAS